MHGQIQAARFTAVLSDFRRRWLVFVLLLCTPGLIEPLACVLHCALMPRTAVLVVVISETAANIRVSLPGGIAGTAHNLCDLPIHSSSPPHQHSGHILPLPLHDAAWSAAILFVLALLIFGAITTTAEHPASFRTPPLLAPPR